MKKMFVQYYAQYSNKIFNYFLYRLNFDRETAEDLTSDVFLKAYDKFDTFDQDRPFQPWIFTIAHNHLVNYYRDSKKEASIEEMAENLGDTIADEKYLQNLMKHMDLENVKTKMKNLRPEDRQIIVLRSVNGLSYKEIAEVLEKTEGAVRVAYNRALGRLIELFN